MLQLKGRLSKFTKFLMCILIILTLLLGVFAFLYYHKLKEFNENLFSGFSKQSKSFSYFVKIGSSGKYKLIVGDLAGINTGGYLKTIALSNKKFNQTDGVILIPSIMSFVQTIPEKLSKEDVLHQISNEKGVIPVDNFCTGNWSRIKEKSIYGDSRLSPGQICDSATQTIDLISIINNYDIENVVVHYNVESYLVLIENFLIYLKERDINYELVQNEQEI